MSLFANYKRIDVAFSHGRGCRLFDTEGNSYLDFLAGIAVSSLGHAHPKLIKAITDQAQRYLHVSNLYRIPEQEEAAARLCKVTGLDRAFFCNSGAEANEALIKLSRRYAHKHGLPPAIMVAQNGFHGRTMGALAATTSNPKYHEGFEPLLQGVVPVPYNDLPAALAALDSVAAVLMEPIQGEGGVVNGQPAFLQGLEAACKERGRLFMLDEVQTGIGRTGRWLAAQGMGLKPHAVALAKGMGGGIPVGAVLATTEVSELLGPGSHGTTFGGNPLAMAAVNAVLATIQEEDLLANVLAMSEHLRIELARLPGVLEVRGSGLLVGVELACPADGIVEACFQQGLLLNAVRPKTLRLAPPLIVSEAEVDEAVSSLDSALTQALATSAA
jgi:acetylornithine/N-succinyldiaminopimelate aminotransferase